MPVCLCVHMYIYVCVFVCMYAHTHTQMSTKARRGYHIPLELELQAFVSHWIWEEGTELLSSARTASTFNHGAICPVLYVYVLNFYQ